MSWNHRIILHDLDPDPRKHWLGLHEVHYGTPGDPEVPGLGWTVEPVTFVCGPDEGAEGIIGSLELALTTLYNPEYSEIIKESEWERHRRPAKPGPLDDGVAER